MTRSISAFILPFGVVQKPRYHTSSVSGVTSKGLLLCSTRTGTFLLVDIPSTIGHVIRKQNMIKGCHTLYPVVNVFRRANVVQIARECVDEEREKDGGENTSLSHVRVECDLRTIHVRSGQEDCCMCV